MKEHLAAEIEAAKAGMGSPALPKGDAYVIAEVGSCHNRIFEEAKMFAHWFGDHEYTDGDAIKFQYFHSGAAVAQHRKAPHFAEMYERYRLPAEWLPELHQEAKRHGLGFLCTTYLMEDIEVVAPYVDMFKIASFEAMNRPFIDAHLKYGKPLLISTGLLTNQELTRLVALRADYGRDRIKLLHCVSTYPCPIEDINLSVISSYNLDGFSDHTAYPQMGALAYMAGARLFEAHVRSQSTPPDNPDYGHALSREQWIDYVAAIRIAAVAHGQPVKQTQASEAHYRAYMS